MDLSINKEQILRNICAQSVLGKRLLDPVQVFSEDERFMVYEAMDWYMRELYRRADAMADEERYKAFEKYYVENGMSELSSNLTVGVFIREMARSYAAWYVMKHRFEFRSRLRSYRKWLRAYRFGRENNEGKFLLSRALEHFESLFPEVKNVNSNKDNNNEKGNY